MDLPFPPGEAWHIPNGVGTPGGHHEGYATFCWDFTLADKDYKAEYPNGTGGAPIHAAASGTVVSSLEGQPTGTKEPNFVEVRQRPGEFAGYMHLRQNSVAPAVGASVPLAQKLALIASTGLEGCHDCNHLHFGVADRAAWTSSGWTHPSVFVTVPVAFSDYEVRTGPDTWRSVARGMPAVDEVVRNPPTPKFGQRALHLGSALARDGGLDVFAADVNGRVWVARWAPGAFARNWDRWRPVLADLANQNTSVAAIARDANKLDIFVAGADGKTYTAAWEAGVAGGAWRGWWNILTGNNPGGTVSAVSRDSSHLDIFISGDGGVYTAAWSAGNPWHGWSKIG
jgi:hypothetical protein